MKNILKKLSVFFCLILSAFILVSCGEGGGERVIEKLLISYNGQMRVESVNIVVEHESDFDVISMLQLETLDSKGDYNGVASLDSIVCKNSDGEEVVLSKDLAVGQYVITITYSGKTATVNLTVIQNLNDADVAITVKAHNGDSTTFDYSHEMLLDVDIKIDGEDYVATANNGRPVVYLLTEAQFIAYNASENKAEFLQGISLCLYPEYETYIEFVGPDLTSFVGYRFPSSDDFEAGVTYYPFAWLNYNSSYGYSVPKATYSFTVNKGDLASYADLSNTITYGELKARYDYSSNLYAETTPVIGNIQISDLMFNGSDFVFNEYENVIWTNSQEEVNSSNDDETRTATLVLPQYLAKRFNNPTINVRLNITKGEIWAPYYPSEVDEEHPISIYYNYSDAVDIPLANFDNFKTFITKGIITASNYSKTNAGNYTAVFNLADSTNYVWREYDYDGYYYGDVSGNQRSFAWKVLKQSQPSVYITDGESVQNYAPAGNVFHLYIDAEHPEYYSTATYVWQVENNGGEINTTLSGPSADGKSYTIVATKCGDFNIYVTNAGDSNFEAYASSGATVSINKIDIANKAAVLEEAPDAEHRTFDVTTTNGYYTVTSDMIPVHDNTLDGGEWVLHEVYDINDSYSVGDSVEFDDFFHRGDTLRLTYVPLNTDIYSTFSVDLTINEAVKIENGGGSPYDRFYNDSDSAGWNMIKDGDIFNAGNYDFSMMQTLFIPTEMNSIDGEIEDSMTINGRILRQGRYFDSDTNTFKDGYWIKLNIAGNEVVQFNYVDEYDQPQTVYLIEDAGGNYQVVPNRTIMEFAEYFDRETDSTKYYFTVDQGVNVLENNSSVLDTDVLGTTSNPSGMSYQTFLERFLRRVLMTSGDGVVYNSYTYTVDNQNSTTQLAFQFSKEGVMEFQYLYSLDTYSYVDDQTGETVYRDNINGSAWASYLYNNVPAEQTNLWGASGSIVLDADAEGNITQITFTLSFKFTGSDNASSVTLVLTPTEQAIQTPSWVPQA